MIESFIPFEIKFTLRPIMKTNILSDNRGQSEVLGVVLIISIVFVAAGATFVTGAALVQESQTQSNVESAEYALSQLNSEASIVALETSVDSKTVDLGNYDTGNMGMEDGGEVKVMIIDPNEGDLQSIQDNPDACESEDGCDVVSQEELNNVVYESNDGQKVAYEAGGVWKSDSNGQTSMVSPPEFHYNGETMTFPIIQVGEDSDLSDGQVTLSSGENEQHFPDEAQDFENPVLASNIVVVVDSEYYQGWEQFYQNRVPGAMTQVDDDEEQVVATLGQPNLPSEFGDSAFATSGDVDFSQGNADIDGPISAGGSIDDGSGQNVCEEAEYECDVESDLSSLDSIVSQKISFGQTSSDVEQIDDINDRDTYDEGVYYFSGSEELNSDIEIDLSDGDVEFIVQDDFSIDRGEIETTGFSENDDTALRVFAGGNFKSDQSTVTTYQSDINNDEVDATRFQVYGTEDMLGYLRSGGSNSFEGVVYAPREQDTGDTHPDAPGHCSAEMCIGTGSPDIHGSFTFGSLDASQNAQVTYDEKLQDIEPQLDSQGFLPPELTYMHVGNNEVIIEG